MGGIDLTGLGVSGVIVAFMAVACTVLWRTLQDERKQAREDQERILPALTKASAAMAEFARTATVLLDRRNRE